MSESILVTGGAGNIGSALVRALVEQPDTEVVVADNLLTGSRDKIRIPATNLTFVKCDVNRFDEISSLFYRFRFSDVFHFAAVVLLVVLTPSRQRLGDILARTVVTQPAPPEPVPG